MHSLIVPCGRQFRWLNEWRGGKNEMRWRLQNLFICALSRARTHTTTTAIVPTASQPLSESQPVGNLLHINSFILLLFIMIANFHHFHPFNLTSSIGPLVDCHLNAVVVAKKVLSLWIVTKKVCHWYPSALSPLSLLPWLASKSFYSIAYFCIAYWGGGRNHLSSLVHSDDS